MNHSPTAYLRELKGAPLSTLLALRIAGQPVGERWLCAATGYSQNPVRDALIHLGECGLAQRNGRTESWQATEEARQLAVDLPASTVAASESQLLTLAGDTTTTTQIEETEAAAVVVVNESRKMTLDLLRQAGIRGSMAGKLAKLAHMTPEYVQAHIDHWRKQIFEKTDSPVGILISRFRDGDLAPELEPGDDREVYTRGAFAQYIDF